MRSITPRIFALLLINLVVVAEVDEEEGEGAAATPIWKGSDVAAELRKMRAARDDTVDLSLIDAGRLEERDDDADDDAAGGRVEEVAGLEEAGAKGRFPFLTRSRPILAASSFHSNRS